MPSWEKAGDEARKTLEEANAKFDEFADEGLEKAKSSKYTGWMIAGGVVAVLLLIILVAELA